MKDGPLEQMTDEMFNYIQKLIQKENKRQERLDRLASQPLRRTSEQKEEIIEIVEKQPEKEIIEMVETLPEKEIIGVVEKMPEDFYETSYKIRLIKDSKNATSDWKDQDTKKWKQNYTVGVCNNLAAPCGEYNDLLVVDLDVYDLEEGINCEILEKFYDNDVMNHKGIVQKTPSGGYHLFFRYRNGLLNHTSLGKYKHIDIIIQHE